MTRIVSLSLMLVIVLIIMASLAYSLLSTLDNAEKEMKSHVGKHVILHKDTLLVLDYSLFSNTYTLSDGKEVSAKLIEEK